MGHSREGDVNLTLSIFWVTYTILYNSSGETTYENKWKDQRSSGMTETMPSFSKYREKLKVRCKHTVSTNLGLLLWMAVVCKRQATYYTQ